MRVGSGLAACALVLGLASAAAAATPAAETAAVLVQNFSFQPPAVTIATGGSVTWTVGTDPEQHTVTPREPGGFEGSGQLFTGDTFSVTFDRAGSFEYFCSLHPNMIGTVEVSVPPSSPVETPSAVPATSPAASSPPVSPPPAGETGQSPTLLIAAGVAALGAIALVLRAARRRA
jgi:plastocyanin